MRVKQDEGPQDEMSRMDGLRQRIRRGRAQVYRTSATEVQKGVKVDERTGANSSLFIHSSSLCDHSLCAKPCSRHWKYSRNKTKSPPLGTFSSSGLSDIDQIRMLTVMMSQLPI